MPDASQTTLTRVTNYSSLGELDVIVADTEFAAVGPGTQTDYTGTSADGQNIAVSQGTETKFEDSAELFAGGFHSFLMFDNDDTDTALTPILIRDEFRTIKERAYFQFINGSAETIDFYALIDDQNTDDTAPVLRDTRTIASGIGEVPIGETRFVVRTADSQETLGSTQLPLQEGFTYTLVYESNGGLQVVLN